jgi:Ca2+-binding RTX toxin-like protein
MHLPTPAVPRRRTRRALLAAALPAALAAAALPAAASAATVETSPDNSRIIYRGAGGENNSLNITTIGSGIEIKDFAGVTERSGICSQFSASTVRCASVSAIDASLGDRNDSTSIRVSTPVFVDGGAGDDSFIAGQSPTRTRVDYRGNVGFDRMSYTPATAAVEVSNDNFNNDGRINFDSDDVGSDVERLIGSRHNDELRDAGQNCCGTSLSGGLGDDFLRGSPIAGGQTFFDMGSSPDGADTVFPGNNLARVDYSKRTQPVNATVGFGPRNDDGETGEGDQIDYRGGAILVDGGSARDTLSSLGSVLTNQNIFLRGQGSGDTLEGGEGAESFDGGPGSDTFLARGGNDTIHASDNEGDIVGCGLGTGDTAFLDNLDGFSGCENRTVVGTLRLAPKTIKAHAGEPAHVRLSWRHPQDWRKLGKIELRLTDDGTPVGKVTIRPRKQRMTADGAMRLVRRQSRLTRKGKTVTARLALRLDDSLAGQTLTADVEATDTRGRRQLERDAGTVRVTQ